MPQRHVLEAAGGTAGHLVQLWVVPPVALETALVLAGTPRVILKPVQVAPPGQPPFASTLLQVDGSQAGVHDDPTPDMIVLGRVLARLSFCLLRPLRVISARVIPKGLREGDEYESANYLGTPPGVGLDIGRVGKPSRSGAVPDVLGADAAPQVDDAIAWFLNGISTPNNPVAQVMSYWAGLETLAPTVRGPVRCNKCQQDIAVCPNCGRPTDEPKATRTMRGFLQDALGVSAAEFNGLYELRNQLAHGRLTVDFEGTQAALDKVVRLELLLLTALKRAMGLPHASAPDIETQPVARAFGLDLRGKVEGSDFYDQPTILPAP